MRRASRLHEITSRDREKKKERERGRILLFLLRQVINAPLLRKRIHWRVHLLLSSCPSAAACDMQIDSISFLMARREEVICQTLPCRSVDRERIIFGGRSIRIAAASFPEVIKYPTKSLCAARWLGAIPKAPSGQA